MVGNDDNRADPLVYLDTASRQGKSISQMTGKEESKTAWILAVDDEEGIRNLIQNALEKRWTSGECM